MKDNLKERKANKRKLVYSVIVLVAVALLTAGLTYAWFVTKMDMATLIEVREPANIAILGPDGSTMTSLDLDYADEDVTDGTVTVRRVICVRSAAEKHRLEIVHTTNLKGLTFTLYPALENGQSTVNDAGYTYKYDSSKKIEGTYINAQNKDSTYKYANNSKHTDNYGTYNFVQAHAEPIYWLANNPFDAKTNSSETETEDDITYYKTYYVCEVTWTETTKETDIFYILAKNVYDNDTQQ